MPLLRQGFFIIMRKLLIISSILCSAVVLHAQELYPYTEPASNMPSKSVSVKLASMFERGRYVKDLKQRYMPEVMFGIDKRWMIHAGLNVSNMYNDDLRWEAARFYAKYRFLSKDDVHKHFRMAAFGAATYSRNELMHNVLNIMMGEQSGVQAGLIATQLWNKLAVSGTGSFVKVLDKEMKESLHADHYAFNAVNYTLSAGYLLFPLEYVDYDQTNVNLYAELLGGRNLDNDFDKYYIDLAPSLQFIFKSTGKLNIGYRFELKGDIYRPIRRQVMVSYEHIFLNALRKRKTR
jgi:hypothetical protein